VLRGRKLVSVCCPPPLAFWNVTQCIAHASVALLAQEGEADGETVDGKRLMVVQLH